MRSTERRSAGTRRGAGTDRSVLPDKANDVNKTLKLHYVYHKIARNRRAEARHGPVGHEHRTNSFGDIYSTSTCVGNVRIYEQTSMLM